MFASSAAGGALKDEEEEGKAEVTFTTEWVSVQVPVMSAVLPLSPVNHPKAAAQSHAFTAAVTRAPRRCELLWKTYVQLSSANPTGPGDARMAGVNHDQQPGEGGKNNLWRTFQATLKMWGSLDIWRRWNPNGWKRSPTLVMRLKATEPSGLGTHQTHWSHCHRLHS